MWWDYLKELSAVESLAEAIAVIALEHSNPVPGSALAEKRRWGIPVNGSATMTDRPMVRARGMPAVE